MCAVLVVPIQEDAVWIRKYRYKKGIDRVDRTKGGNVKTYGHSFKVRGKSLKEIFRGKFVPQRLVGAWNKLQGGGGGRYNSAV